jgi:hypothetical protein
MRVTCLNLLRSPSKEQTSLNKHAPHRERILDYFPASSHGSILLTSRTKDAALEVVERSSIISVEQMEAEHAVELMRKKLNREHTHEEALELTKALDYMPLANVLHPRTGHTTEPVKTRA